jgi:DeoR/GlpR family transcriptional regulator of sugar metabolism
MLGSQRKAEIVERVRRDGSVVAAELAIEWNVSEDTIRRDLRDLAAEDRVHRVHGGAVPLSPAAADFVTRTRVASAEKAAVARTAAAMITAGQTVFLDGGTTTAAICRALSPTLEVTVVTHSPTVAVALVDHPSARVLLIGFMGVSGVHQTHGLTTGDAEEAAMKRAISRRAADTFVLASSEKLGSALPHHVVGFNEVTAAITDERNARILKGLRRAGLQIIQAAQ